MQNESSKVGGNLPSGHPSLKKIQAIIRREKFGNVMDALELINCPGFTAWAIEGRGQSRRQIPSQPFSFTARLIPMVKLEVVAEDAEVDLILRTIQETAVTGQEGDEKLFVSPVEQSIRIRNGKSIETTKR